MHEFPYLSGAPSLQDRDLLQRLTDYFDSLDVRLRHGEGWVIFNASGQRATRITQYVLSRAREMRPFWTYLFVPWRDFALTSYLVQVELKSIQESDDELSDAARRGYDIATRVSRETMVHSVTTDLLIVSGLLPRYEHEVRYFEETIERRYRDRLATIILTPEQPHELARDIANHAPLGQETWERLATRFWEINRIAV